MKRIYFTIIILLTAMVTLAYLYFSKLNKDTNTNEASLHIATAQSGLIFCIQNNKSILDLLDNQDLLQCLLNANKLKSLKSLQQQFLFEPDLSKLIQEENIYISFIPEENKELNFLISTQTDDPQAPKMLLHLLRSKNLQVNDTAGVFKLTTKDSLSFYFKQKDNLILLSPSAKLINNAINKQEDKGSLDFAEYIKSNNKLTKNSIANVYLNFNHQQSFLKLITPNELGEGFFLFNQKDQFASLSYNYSKEKILFNGNTVVRDPLDFMNLFASVKADKITIDAILPENTANYTVYTINNYMEWSSGLKKWFVERDKDRLIERTLGTLNSNYHLNPEDLFPRSFQNQLITFELKNGEKFGAVNLKNGDKLNQLLLDISEDYSPYIKLLKEPNLLYAYFGQPFEHFQRPYYTIIDNYMIFANNPGSMEAFLDSYTHNKLLINNKAYTQAYGQLPNTSTILFYSNRKNGESIVLNNLYPANYNYYKSSKNLGSFESFIYQLSADHKNFQTNLLIQKNVIDDKNKAD